MSLRFPSLLNGRQRLVALLAGACLLPSTAVAQHALGRGAHPGATQYDAAVPTPAAVLGYELGERFTPHHMIMRYLERLAATSGRLRVDTLGHTFEGREVVMAIVTSEANHLRLPEIQATAQRIARGDGDAAAIAAMPSIAWLGYTVHGNEASGTEAALGLLYQLAAGQDDATRTILDSLVVLIDPVQNPDGHERHVQDNMRRRGALGVPVTPGAMIHSGNWPGARTSHYQFDLNRDWFILSHPESRARVAAFNRWFPHVAVDLHEMGSNSTYFFAPPMEPVNKNVHESIIRWWDIYAAANAATFDMNGWSFFRREGYDEFYPGYGVSWPILTGAVGMTYEQASSSGGAIRRSDGTVLTLHQAAMQHYAAAWATLRTTALRRAERVRDYVEFRRSAITESARAPMRSVVIGNDGQGRADSLALLLIRNGIAVARVGGATEITGTAYGSGRTARTSVPAGSYAVDLAQPQGRLARALLEPDAVLDSAFIREELEARRTGRSDRFYDVTAWALPYTYRVPAWHTSATLAGDVVTASSLSRAASNVTTGIARYGYAWAPGSEASLRLLSSLLADSVRVWYAPRAFRVAGQEFPHGAFIVRQAENAAPPRRLTNPQAPREAEARAAQEWLVEFNAAVQAQADVAGVALMPLGSALVDDGTDLGSNSVVPLRSPRVALLGDSPVNGNSFGFAWFAFDQRLGYPSTAISSGAVGGGILSQFDVLVVPSAPAGALDNALGEGGRQRLTSWVRDGGVLITLDGATAWLARESLGLSRLRARAPAPDSAGAPLPASVPGAVVRTTADTLSPLLAGVRDLEVPVLAGSDRIYTAPGDVRPGEVVLRFAPASRLRLAGYLWPEVPARLGETPYLWTERVGRGRVIAFHGDPNFRDLWRGLLPIFANAVFLGGTF